MNFEPHSRSGRAMPLVPVASLPLITGASLAFLLLYRGGSIWPAVYPLC
ncbi:hypothetical protein [Xenorhabdus bovienii]|nr:hypothetical protein [Xenorhabdus bovienii]MDE9549305.1 hypothetical protein [Xenorhabdus bovienii]